MSCIAKGSETPFAIRGSLVLYEKHTRQGRKPDCKGLMSEANAVKCNFLFEEI